MGYLKFATFKVKKYKTNIKVFVIKVIKLFLNIKIDSLWILIPISIVQKYLNE